MKKIIFVLVQVFSFIVFAGSPNPINDLTPIQLQEYKIGQSNSIHLRTDFSKKTLNPSELNNQSIYQVDLIYTKCKTKD
jgi:hypothetical protein